MTLRLKLLILVAGMILLATLGVTSVALWRELGQAQEHLECEGTALAASVASAAPRWLGEAGVQPGARDGLTQPLQRAMAAAPLVRAWVVDRQGAVVACVDPGGLGCPPGAPSDLRAPHGPLEALDHLARRAPLESSAPIVKNGELVGAVRISFRPDQVIDDARRLAWRAAVIACAWILLGMSLGSVLIRRITRPLTEVARAAEALPGDEGIHVDVEADPELRELVAAFNRMSSRVRDGREELQRLIASLNQRVAEATAEGLKAERLATLGGIAAGFAHEMGNSLHVIAGFTKIVLRELGEDDPHRQDLAAVKRETDRAAALLERFLFFARTRSAHSAAQSIAPVLREVVEVVGPAAKDAHVTTSLEVDEGLPLVQVDAELLRQAFLNLCVNALQAMSPAGGKLVVRARKRQGGLCLEFEDDGPGIPSAARERIFEPFFTTKAEGTGLGLAIVRHAAEANGGSVEVKSEPGHGALFRICLPAAASQGAAP